jgi:hypothetical protein
MSNTPQGNNPTFFGQKVSVPGINVNSAGDDQLILKDDYSSRIYYNDRGIPTVLLGLRPNTSPVQRGFYVSQDGIDVTTASDSQLIFNSGQDIFKVVTSSTTQIPSFSLGNSQLRVNSITIPHGLPFVPILQAYALITLTVSLNGSTFTQITGYVALPWMPASFYLPDAAVNAYNIISLVDATNIYFSYEYSTTSGGGGFNFPTVPIRYYLLQETVA